MVTESFVRAYWGKAQPREGVSHPFHPLAYHGLDVAAAGNALMAARPQLLTALARAVGLPESVARQWFLFALALHDIGKFTCSFQCKVPELWHHKDVLPGGPKQDLGHGSAGAALWANGCKLTEQKGHPFASLFTGQSPQGGTSIARKYDIWFQAVCGHHGRPVAASDLSGRICEPALNDARDYIHACAALLAPEPPPDFKPPKECNIAASSWLVAGVAMLADWIGSNQEWFPYHAPTLSLPQYWQEAQRRAAGALKNAGLATAHVSSAYTLNDALPGVSALEATPLQAWVSNEAQIRGQSLIFVEDLTGAGKTEAALILTHKLMQTGVAEGLYWALPTMATADALYGRLAKSYDRLFANPEDTSLVLAHSSREFNEIFKKSIKLGVGTEPRYPGVSKDEDSTVTSTAACARWIADDRRKTFLADVGVGTIDQALLGVLPSKHQAMRLAALSRRVLVIDEIHSFDAYQNSLVEKLLEFHAAFGGSAILISATLTQAARRKLAQAFARGANGDDPKLEADAFPLATVLSAGDKPIEKPLRSSRGTRRDLPVERLDDEAAALSVLEAAAREGRAAVWVRNTVQDALDAHAALRDRLPEVEVGLFHARFALGDRLKIQESVLTNFGKKSSGDQRKRILIATQVVEQSLDCDWDVMISDLAPIDLLIQRAGRLHRHDHRGERPDPVLHVMGPEPSNDAGKTWYAKAFPRAQRVYPDHGQLWLTMKALIEAGGLKLESASPRHLIEYVFGGNVAIPKGLESVSGEAAAKAMSARAIGRMNTLQLEKGYVYVHHAGAWESDTRTPTRLGDASRVLRLYRWDGKALRPWWPIDNGDERRAWRLSEVAVRAGRVKAIAKPDTALDRAIEAEIAKWPDRYDPPLLVPLVENDGEWHMQAIDNDDRPLSLRYDPLRGLRFIVA